MVIVAAAAWYHFAFGGFVIHGTVLDSATGQPIAAARVWSSRADTLSSPEGSFALDRVKPPEMLSFDAPGYRAQVLRVSTPFDPLTPSLEPIGVEIDAVDADTGQPVAAVFDAGASSSLGPGRIKVAPVLANQKFNLTADGYIPAETYYGGQDVLRVVNDELKSRFGISHSTIQVEVEGCDPNDMYCIARAVRHEPALKHRH